MTPLWVVATEPWSRSDILTAWSLGLACFGVVAALYTLHRGNLNASVASMIPLNAEIREAWKRFLASTPNSGQATKRDARPNTGTDSRE
jgi:hypothetical protein